MARVLASLVLVACLVGVYSAPQFGGFSQASAQSGAFGGYRPGFQGPQRPPGFGGLGFGRPGVGGPGFGGPGFNRPGFGGPGFGGPGFGGSNSGGSISISKSISISRGGGGVAQSSAQSSASGK